MKMTRRDFVRGGVSAFTLSFAAPAFLSDIARAQGSTRRNLVVLYLAYVEIVVLRRICEWCTATHALVLLMLLLALRGLQAAALQSRREGT